MTEPKRFDEWNEVECTECAHWWDSSCDGPQDKRPCNSYLASRKVLIPERIERLTKAMKVVFIILILNGIMLVLNGLWVIFNG